MRHEEDKIGYKNPPKHSQWQKGQSGNPNGRPKKSNTIAGLDDFYDLLINIMGEEAVVNMNGEVVSLSHAQLVIKKLLAKAAQGDTKSIKMLTDMYQKALRSKSTDPKENGGIQIAYLDADDLALAGDCEIGG